ncbi:MAG: 2OG-Fe dioxygenase family protein, partial [Stellaceae bacterium]
MTKSLAALAAAVEHDGFAFARAPEMGAILERAGLRDWSSFAASWDDLGVDTYMADGGRYRRRRFAAFRAGPAGIVRKPHQPH